MKTGAFLPLFILAFVILIGAKLHAVEPESVARYYTLAPSTDRLVLTANEAAIIDRTVGFDWTYNWMNILYKRAGNDFVNIILPLGLTGGTMPLAGPCVIMLNTNDVFMFGAEYTGAVRFKVVRQRPSERYVTLAYPTDRLLINANETAIIDGTVGFDWEYTSVDILYNQGSHNFADMELPLGLTGDTTPLAGPSTIMLNKNNVLVYGAEYTGAVGLKVVHNSHSKIIE
jgi:hypothetical protein